MLEEMMRKSIENYFESIDGKMLMLLTITEMFNRKTLEEVQDLIDETTFMEWELKDIEHISKEISETLNSYKDKITTLNCEVFCKAVLETSDVLSSIKMQSDTISNIRERINSLYISLLLFGIRRRILSREEFFELTGDAEAQDEYDGQYSLPERNYESKLVKYGYSVAQNSHLSNIERQDLLRRIIESKEVSKGYIVSYLKHMIAINGKKKNNHIALRKWQSDLEYVLSL